MKYTDVFVPGGFPKYTYNPREGLRLEATLAQVKDNLCKLVTITGNTKSGKTVLTRTILPREEAIWIDGGAVSEESDFWDVIVEQLNLFQVTSKSVEKSTVAKIGAKFKAAAQWFGFFKVETEHSADLEKGRTEAENREQVIGSRIAALRGLRNSSLPIVIDDFHYLPKALQGSVVRALKPLIFDGHPVVLIAIPHRRYDAVKVEKEMTGRILPLQIPAWTPDELIAIPQKGFALLNRTVATSYMTLLAEHAIGSPHLMQEFCREICRRDIDLSAHNMNDPLAVLLPVFQEVAETIGRPIFEKLARGPRQRSDRVARKLKNGETVDIYQLVLHALAHLKPGLVSIEYEGLRSAIRDVSDSGIPQAHEVARVLKHMATIAATDQSSTPVIDFDDEDKKLHITDPFFAFYLRWGSLSG